MPWVLLGAAITTEVASTLALRGSEGFSRLVPSIITIVGYVASFVLLAIVLKSLPVGIVYAIWSAVGIALVAVFGKLIFDDPVPPLAMFGMALIIGGVVLVGASGATRT
ncbi:MAG: multidrug efflux SMR transporter [Chloroflexi bacterium]|nr:MAG: hypothetical protein AUI15_08925 [Actinobacteria bacterium 13_2_20CM_2_66_6]TMB78878.1 MAG: multidrug efflux SMR transporter [Chloroflexota bacterium]TMF72648.1 MAG: multidrug efflux SMR transporter [Chloroflexota bacterium]TMF73560.1 MAG: multidrug efflux SMR transporter [Chloroflexota bacterium]TMF92063.1 MAG: multidrug efflux SMR transporter [Chloroflexota bacterium]